jgi:F5/8 type C domain
MSASWSLRRLAGALSLALVAGLAVVTIPTTASAASTAYYVDSRASCPGSGTLSSPYCDFSVIDTITFQPGDSILLARGAVFNVSNTQTLTLDANDGGTPSAWNTVGPYGSGSAPVITGNNTVTSIGIQGTDLDYWHFTGIEFSALGTAIGIKYKTVNHNGLQFDNLNIHDLADGQAYSGRGIYIDTGSANSAIKATPSASSTEPGYTLANINDGATGDWTGWSSASGAAMPQWAELDWPSAQTISKVDLFTNSGYPIKDVQIQYWNGSSWVTPTGASIAGNTQKYIPFAFSPISTTKVRAYVTAGDVYNIARIEDFQVFAETPPVPTASQWVADSISFVDNTFGNLGMPIVVDGLFSTKINAFKDVLVLRNYIHDVVWDQAFRYVTNLHWLDNRDERMASGSLGGTTDLHLWALQGAKFDNSIFNTVYDHSTHDQVFGDLAYRLDDLNIRNNLFENAAGPALEWHSWRSTDEDGRDTTANYYTNQTVTGNAFSNNATSPSPILPLYKSSLLINNVGGGCHTTPSGTVRDNLYFEPTGFLNDEPCPQAFALTNNRPVAAASNVSSSAASFNDSSCSAGGWSFARSTDGSTWTSLSTISTVAANTDVRCTASGVGAWGNRFELMPESGATSSVARQWTAPATGLVSIRSLALKSDLGGDGVTVRVTKNGTTVIPAAAVSSNDRQGVSLNADEVSVTAGDVIRFEVAGGSTSTSDRLSWSPTIAYASANLARSATPSASSTDPSYSVSRVNDGNTADWSGWSANGAVTPTNPQWVELDWASSQTIGRVDFTTTDGGYGYETQDFQIQYWNGSSWVTPSGASITGNTRKLRSIPFSPVTTTKLRVFITKGDVPSGGARIDELEVYSY